MACNEQLATNGCYNRGLRGSPELSQEAEGPMVKTIEWTEEGVRMVDQRRLPAEEVYVTCRDYREVADAIRSMVIRGAPAIGVAAAMGVALGVKNSRAATLAELRADFEKSLARDGSEPEKIAAARADLIEEAKRVLAEDIAVNQAIGRHGMALVQNSANLLTHCNAGALATGGYGTALGVIRSAVADGKKVRVFVDETRPFLQGARLTAWELAKDGIPVTLITDSMAGHFMKRKEIQAVIVGADRIAANGDVANKIGTYTLAVLARENQIPFYVAAPLSTLDLSLASGDEIPIEERSPSEVTHLAGVSIAPKGIEARHPAFDVTPHEYVSAIITERGIAREPYKETLKALF